MKKTIAIVLLVALLVAVLPASALAAKKEKVYRVNTKNDNLMVHSVPNGDKATRIGSLAKDSAVIIQKSSGNWKFIKSARGLGGWVYGGYLAGGAYAKVDTKETGLNIHKGANTKKSTIIGSAPKGAKVLVQYVQGTLANIVYMSLNGWSSRSYLKWIVK